MTPPTTNAGSLRPGDLFASGAQVLAVDSDGTRVAVALRDPFGAIVARVFPVVAIVEIRKAVAS